MIEITDAQFSEEVLKSEIPVLVDFWAPWCGPCRAIAPILEQLYEEYQGRFKIVKVNSDENEELVNTYSIRSIPTLIVFKNGELKDNIQGALPKQKLKEMIEFYL